MIVSPLRLPVAAEPFASQLRPPSLSPSRSTSSTAPWSRPRVVRPPPHHRRQRLRGPRSDAARESRRARLQVHFHDHPAHSFVLPLDRGQACAVLADHAAVLTEDDAFPRSSAPFEPASDAFRFTPVAACGKSQAKATASNVFVPNECLHVVSINIRSIIANLAELEVRLALLLPHVACMRHGLMIALSL